MIQLVAADAYFPQRLMPFNPHIYGLPETRRAGRDAVRGPQAHATHGGVNVRHGTDFYQFDGGEMVQPELINLARFVLSWFGGDCCAGEYDTCAETDDRGDVFHHNC